MLCFTFAIRKTLQILWKMFLIPSLSILQKKPPCQQVYKKQIFYKKIQFLFFWCHEKSPNFSSKSLSFSMITDSFLVSASRFWHNVLTETPDICFRNFWNFLSCTLPFFYIKKFGILKIHQKVYFSLLSLAITNRGGISILTVCIAYKGPHSLWSPSFFWSYIFLRTS